MDDTRLYNLLRQKGELIITVEELGPVELHRHDTTVHDGEVRLSLEDGNLVIDADRVTAVAWHKGSLEDLGL